MNSAIPEVVLARMTRGLDTIPAHEKDDYPFTVKVLGEKNLTLIRPCSC